MHVLFNLSYLFIYLFVCLFVCLCISILIYVLICLLIYLFIHLFMFINLGRMGPACELGLNLNRALGLNSQHYLKSYQLEQNQILIQVNGSAFLLLCVCGAYVENKRIECYCLNSNCL